MTSSKAVGPVFQKFGIRKAILFGSFAKGRQTRKSDIDLILIQEERDAGEKLTKKNKNKNSCNEKKWRSQLFVAGWLNKHPAT
jgi:predicted nucleotidyltransferase